MLKALIVLAIWAVLAGLYAAGVFAWTAAKEGGAANAVAYYKANPVYKDWYALGRGLIPLSMLLVLVAAKVKADEPVYQFHFLEYTQVYMGLDYQDDAPECKQNGEYDSVTANAGVRQHLAGITLWGWLEFNATAGYLHHSCAAGDDDKVYDGVGGMVDMTINW